jgi:hypothetical protein
MSAIIDAVLFLELLEFYHFGSTVGTQSQLRNIAGTGV